MLRVSISVFVKKVIHRGHGSHDRLVRSICILASSSPPKPRRFRILNGLLYFFPEYMEIFPFDRPPLFNPNLRTQSVLLFLRQLVRPDNQRFQLREHVQIPH
jgi:hypothetical protein